MKWGSQLGPLNVLDLPPADPRVGDGVVNLDQGSRLAPFHGRIFLNPFVERGEGVEPLSPLDDRENAADLEVIGNLRVQDFFLSGSGMVAAALAPKIFPAGSSVIFSTRTSILRSSLQRINLADGPLLERDPRA
jgi:hypothetical protein